MSKALYEKQAERQAEMQAEEQEKRQATRQVDNQHAHTIGSHNRTLQTLLGQHNAAVQQGIHLQASIKLDIRLVNMP